MKDYIEIINKNEEKPCKTLLRKDAIIGIDEREEGSRLVIIADDGAKKCILYSATSYDENKAALASQADVEGVKKIIDDLVNEVVVGPNDIGVDGYYFKVGDGFAAIDFLRRFAKQLKERLDSGLNNEN